MGMPVTVEINDTKVTGSIFDEVFLYLEYIDQTFSTYKDQSEISRINRHELELKDACEDVKTIFALAEETRLSTDGFFDIQHEGLYDPSGIVKGWAIFNAAEIIREKGFENFYVEAGGDIQTFGVNAQGQEWRVGIRNPFNMDEIVKVVAISNCGIATSGTYIRGQHIYNPNNRDEIITDVLSLTVIGPDIYEADRFATAAFAMGHNGIMFIENLQGFEGYMINQNKMATYTTGFERYVLHD